MKAKLISLTLAMAFGLLFSVAALGTSASAQTYPPPVGSLTGTSSTTTPPVATAPTLSATVLDAAGNPVAGAEVIFQIVTQPGGATFTNGQTQIAALTGANGVATVTLSVGSTSGSLVVKMISGEKTTQLTLQVQPAAPGGVPATGGQPPSQGDGGGPQAWQAAIIAAGLIVLLTGGIMVIRRRRA